MSANLRMNRRDANLLAAFRGAGAGSVGRRDAAKLLGVRLVDLGKLISTGMLMTERGRGRRILLAELRRTSSIEDVEANLRASAPRMTGAA